MPPENPVRSEWIQLPKKPIPLVAPFLQALRQSGIYCTKEDLIGHLLQLNSHPRIAESYLLSLGNREMGDNSAILAPLIGVSKSKEQTKEIVTRIGSILLKRLDQYGDEDKKIILSILANQREPNDENILLKIDELAGQGVGLVKNEAYLMELADPNLDNMTPAAYTYREKNRKALDQLVQIFGGRLYNLLNREPDYDCNGILEDIYQTPRIPKIDASPLLAILPDELNRNIHPEPPPVDNPSGLVARLNMAGSDVLRYLADIAKDKRIIQLLEEHFH